MSDNDGGVIVLWNDDRGSREKIYAQRLNRDGVAQWATDGVPVCTADSLESFSRAVPDGFGGVIVFWKDTRRAPPPTPPHYHRFYDIFCQRISASGAIEWDPAGVPVCADSGFRGLTGTCVVPDGSGGAILVFVDGLRSAGYYAQHVDGSGSRQWNPDGSLIPTIGGVADVVRDGAGGVWVATADARNGVFNVWVEHLNSLGQVVSTPGGIHVSDATTDQALDDRFDSAASDDSGGVIVAWADTRNGQDRDVFAQRVLASGAIDPRWPVNGFPVCTATGVQINPVIMEDGMGGAIVGWSDTRNASTEADIYVQHLTATGLIAAGWIPNGVALCTAAKTQGYPDIVLDSAGGAIACWDDDRGSDVNIYAQRVSAAGAVGAITTGVDLPSPISLMLEAPRPNPASRDVLVSFSLPGSEPARVSLYDIVGREIQSLDVGPLGPGRHVVDLHAVESMSPGIYLVRLTRGARSLARHFAVVR